MQQYNAISGQSYSDICLNTYGTMDYYAKLLHDNNLTPDGVPYSNQPIMWDETVVVDQTIYKSTTQVGVVYSTLYGLNNSSYYKVIGGDTPVYLAVNPIPVNPSSQSMYYKPLSTLFTAEGGEQYFSLSALQGAVIQQVEREIKPLRPDEYTFDGVVGKITLLGDTLSEGETVFILYSKIITV